MTQISGQLRTVTDLTQRDIVLGFLLAVDTLLRPADVAPVPGRYDARPLNERESTAVLFHVIRHCLGAIPDPGTFPASHGYGLPDWLIAEKPDAPLFTLFDRLTDRPSEAWRELAEELQSPTWQLFDELDQFYQSLAKSAGRTAAAPVQAFRALPDKIADETEAIVVGATSVLAARSPARRGFDEVEKLARRALEYNDDNISELAWRQIRFDFPLVVSRQTEGVLNTHGVLIGAELSFGGSKPRVMLKNEEAVLELLMPPPISKDRWRPCDHAFSNSVKQATKAAVGLLRQYGLPEEKLAYYQNPQLYLRGLLPPTPVEGASIGLPLALEILRRALDLPTPEWVASGAIDESGRIQSLEDHALVAKWQSVHSDGLKRGLLAAGTPQKIPSDQLQLLGEESRTLRDAAALLWENDWRDKVKEFVSTWHRDRGFIPGWTQEESSDAAYLGGKPIVVETEQAEKIVTFFQARGDDFGFLVSPPKTGKTWIARQVRSRLEHTGQWQVDTLSVQPLKQPTIAGLRDAIRQVLSSEPKRRPRRLVIIDGLESNEGLDDFERAMSAQAASAGVSILAVARSLPSVAEKQWVTEDCTSFHAIGTPKAINQFFEKAFEQFPALEKARELSGAIRNYARRDLWWMLHLHAFAAETPASSCTELVRRFLESRLSLRISEREFEPLKSVAALSLCSAFVPDDQIPKEPETVRAALRSLGATLVPDRGWIIDSHATCHALLGAEVKNGNLIPSEEITARISPTHVKTVLMRAIDGALDPAVISQDSASALTMLSRLRQHFPGMLARVLELTPVPERLQKWAESLTKPVELALVIDILAPHIDSEKLHALLRLLVSLVLNSWNKLHCRGLAFCIRVLRRERSHIDDGQKPLGSVKQPGWGPLMAELEREGLGEVLQRRARSESKLELLEELWRTYDDSAHHALAKNVSRMVPAGPPYRVEDYRLAHRLIVVLKHIVVSYDTPQVQRGLNHVRNECQKIANWEIPKESDPAIDQILMRWTLRQALLLGDGDWSALAAEIGSDLRAGVERSTLSQLCTGLSALAQESRPFATRVLDGIGSSWLAQLLIRRTCSIGEVATLLGTISNIHAIFAYHTLYERSEPRQNLMRVLRQRVHEAGDAKGAGRILYATRKIDELFGKTDGGFADELCSLIGRDFLEYHLHHECRVSVLFHLIRGYLSTEASLSEQIWETVCDVAVETIKDTLRPWAPQLALLMSESEQIGQKFIERLLKGPAGSPDKGLPGDRVLAGMVEAYSVDGLEAFHRLGRLYSRVADSDAVPLANQFLNAYPRSSKIILSLSRQDRPDVLLRAIRAVGDTLRRAGAKEAAKGILADQRPKEKVEALRNSPAGDVATTLHLWRQIDQNDAAMMVGREATKEILFDKLKRTTTQPHLGVDLVGAVEEASRGAGQALLERFKHNESMWTAFLEELAYDQNPVTQGYAFLNLCRHGAQPDPALRFRVYDKVWLPKIETLTSPAAIAALLRASAAWEERWGLEAAARVNVTRLERRLVQGCRVDFDGAAALIGTLHALGQTASASRLAQTVVSIPDVEKRSSLEAWQFLLPVLTVIAPEDAKRLGNGVAERAARAVANPYILDEEPFWQTIGWIAYCCRQSQSDALRIATQPPTFSAVLDPGTRLWATTWLAEADWATQARTSAWQEILKKHECAAEMKIPVVVALTHLRNLEAVLFRAGRFWFGRPSRAPTPLISVLLRAGRTDELKGGLAPHIPAIREELDQSYNRADFFAGQARAMLRGRDALSALTRVK